VFPLRALNTSSQKWFAGLRAGPQKYTGRSMKESQHRICNHNGDSRDLTPNSLMIPRARGRAHAPKDGSVNSRCYHQPFRAMYVAGPNPREQFSGSRPSEDRPYWCPAEANVALTP
jgi:hypothetical protein